MLKLTEAFGKHPIFVSYSDVVAVQKTDDCTLVYTKGNHCFEVLEDSEAIVRYVVAKGDWTGNDKYDTLTVRNITSTDYPNEFEDITDTLDYGIAFLNKQIDSIENGEDDPIFKGSLERYKKLKESISSISRRLISVNVREVE